MLSIFFSKNTYKLVLNCQAITAVNINMTAVIKIINILFYFSRTDIYCHQHVKYNFLYFPICSMIQKFPSDLNHWSRNTRVNSRATTSTTPKSFSFGFSIEFTKTSTWPPSGGTNRTAVGTTITTTTKRSAMRPWRPRLLRIIFGTTEGKIDHFKY